MLFLKDGPQLNQKHFFDRAEAGLILASKLKDLKIQSKNLITCAIPRGGVVVGAEISQNLNCRLTVLPIKKITAPQNPELAIGAVAAEGQPILDRPLIALLQIDKAILKAEIEKAKKEAKRRIQEYQVKKPNFYQKVVILTDDGVATGATIGLAAKIIKNSKPAKLILAVPVAPKSKLNQLKKSFDQVVVLLTPEDFQAVGQFYQNFPQVTDEEVVRLLAESNEINRWVR